MSKLTKRLFALVCAFLLFAGLCAPSGLAFDLIAAADASAEVLPCCDIPLYINDSFLGSGILVDSTTLVPFRTFTEALLQKDCSVTWDQETGTAVLTAEGLTITLTMDDGYMVANGRYIYLEDRVYNINGTIVVPIRELSRIFGAEVEWNGEDRSVSIDADELRLLEPGDTFYSEEDLYWLSHVIYSESGNQPLRGMIGVGNVVLNRAADESGLFGKGIEGVIFYPGQFDVVPAGTIWMEPSEKAVVAAKLCLEGYNTVGDAKWFVNPAIGSTRWFRTYKTLAVSIADHDFYS